MDNIVNLKERVKSKKGYSIDDIAEDNKSLKSSSYILTLVNATLKTDLVKMLNDNIHNNDKMELSIVPMSEIAYNMLPNFITANIVLRGQLVKLSLICKSSDSCYIMISEGALLECYHLKINEEYLKTVRYNLSVETTTLNRHK